MSQKGYERLQEKLGYRFSDVETLKRALTHSSFDGDKFHNNQRLEYLGDAVLQLIISDELFKVETFSEGQMTRLRSLIVREEALYAAAKEFGLGNMLILGKGEELSGGGTSPPSWLTPWRRSSAPCTLTAVWRPPRRPFCC